MLYECADGESVETCWHHITPPENKAKVLEEGIQPTPGNSIFIFEEPLDFENVALMLNEDYEGAYKRFAFFEFSNDGIDGKLWCPETALDRPFYDIGWWLLSSPKVDPLYIVCNGVFELDLGMLAEFAGPPDTYRKRRLDGYRHEEALAMANAEVNRCYTGKERTKQRQRLKAIADRYKDLKSNHLYIAKFIGE